MSAANDATARRTYPLDYMDRGCVAATSAERGCSNCPTWELRVAGRLEPDICRRALAGVLARYPSCAALVRPHEDDPAHARKLHYEVQDGVEVDAIFRYVDLCRDTCSRGDAASTEGEGALEKLRLEIRDRLLDPYRDLPLHVTLARIAPDRSVLFFQQHHALCDGRAFIQMLQDFAVFARCAETGEPAPEALASVYPRQDEMAALEIGRLRAMRWWFAGLGIWAGIALRTARRPLVPLLENAMDDLRGSNGMLHLALDRSLLERWRPLRARAGVSLTGLLAGALFVASRRMNLAAGITPGHTRISIVAETRPRHGSFHSFANHLGGLMADYPLADDPEPVDLMRSISQELAAQVKKEAHKKRLVLERAMTQSLPIPTMRKAVFEAKQPSANLNLSNLISLRFPPLSGRAWKVDAIEITTPVLPPFGVMLTVIDYAGKLRFNFNYKSSVVTRDQAAMLRTEYQRALDQMERALAALPEPPGA